MLLAAGCGGSSSTTSSAAQTSGQTTTQTTSSAATDKPSSTAKEAAAKLPSTAHMTLSSPIFQSGRSLGAGEHAIAARYTCDGSNTSPPMHWSGVPKGTHELVLLVLDLTASTSASTRTFVWSVGGLKPTLHGIATGKLPPGAAVGRNNTSQNRYSVCPAKGGAHTFAIFFYALRHPLSLRTGFDPNAVYTKIGGAGLPQAQSGFAYERN